MDVLKIALLKIDGTIQYIDFLFNELIDIEDLEKIIENKGDNFQVIEEGHLNRDLDYSIIGYKTGNKFNKHDIASYNIMGDAIFMIWDKNDDYIDVKKKNLTDYFSFELIEEMIQYDEYDGDEDDEFDFNDGFIVNDLI